MHEVVGHREREVAADRPGRASAGFVAPIVVRTTEIAPSPSSAERQRRRRSDELDQLAEERLLGVLRVVLLGEVAVDLDESRLARRQAAPLEAREDLPGERRAAPRRA